MRPRTRGPTCPHGAAFHTHPKSRFLPSRLGPCEPGHGHFPPVQAFRAFPAFLAFRTFLAFRAFLTSLVFEALQKDPYTSAPFRKPRLGVSPPG